MEGVRVFSDEEVQASGMTGKQLADQELRETLQGLAKHLFGEGSSCRLMRQASWQQEGPAATFWEPLTCCAACKAWTGLDWRAGCCQRGLPAACTTMQVHASCCLTWVTAQSGHRLPDTCATCCCAGDVQMKFVDAYFPFTVSTQSA